MKARLSGIANHLRGMEIKKILATGAIAASVLLTACGDSDDSTAEEQSKNASAIETELRKLPYTIEVIPGGAASSLEGPGIVVGRAMDEDGSVTDFIFSVGPDPVKLPGKDGVWISGGDQFYLTPRARKNKLTPKQEDTFRSISVDLENAGCQAIIGEICPL